MELGKGDRAPEGLWGRILEEEEDGLEEASQGIEDSQLCFSNR